MVQIAGSKNKLNYYLKKYTKYYDLENSGFYMSDEEKKFLLNQTYGNHKKN